MLRLAGRIAQSNLQELPLPYRLTYAVTNRCQAHCAMCNIWQKPVQDELTLAEIDAIFANAHHFSWINLTGGELFQRPDILDIILTIIKRSPHLYLLNFPTNGIQTDAITAVVDTILKQTALPRLIVTVSLDGPPRVHDSIRGIPGCWQHAVESFRQLQKRCSRRFSVYFGHTIQSANVGTFDLTRAACQKELAHVTIDDFHINLAHASGHYYDNADTKSLAEPEQALQEMERICGQRRFSPFDPVAYIERHYQAHTRYYLKHGRSPLTCQAAAASCFINPTGIVYPCTVFDSPLGALRDHNLDFYRLWNTASRLNVRQSIRHNACPGCWTPCEAYQTILANLLAAKVKL